MIIKLEIHMRCFAFLLKKPKETKIYQENALQQISSTNFPQFFREIFTFYEIMKQSLNEKKVNSFFNLREPFHFLQVGSLYGRFFNFDVFDYERQLFALRKNRYAYDSQHHHRSQSP